MFNLTLSTNAYWVCAYVCEEKNNKHVFPFSPHARTIKKIRFKFTLNKYVIY